MNYADKRHTRASCCIFTSKEYAINRQQIQNCINQFQKGCIYLSKVILEFVQKDMIYTCVNFMLHTLYRFYISLYIQRIRKPINYAFIRKIIFQLFKIGN